MQVQHPRRRIRCHGQPAAPGQLGGDFWVGASRGQQVAEAAACTKLGDDAGRISADAQEANDLGMPGGGQIKWRRVGGTKGGECLGWAGSRVGRIGGECFGGSALRMASWHPCIYGQQLPATWQHHAACRMQLRTPTHLRLASREASACSCCMMGADRLSARCASLALATWPTISTLTATSVPNQEAR